MERLLFGCIAPLAKTSGERKTFISGNGFRHAEIRTGRRNA
jgi:hypothetical protein